MKWWGGTDILVILQEQIEQIFKTYWNLWGIELMTHLPWELGIFKTAMSGTTGDSFIVHWNGLLHNQELDSTTVEEVERIIKISVRSGLSIVFG
jgi:hypothetical protein